MRVGFEVTKFGILIDMNLFIFRFYFFTMANLYELENDLQKKDAL